MYIKTIKAYNKIISATEVGISPQMKHNGSGQYLIMVRITQMEKNQNGPQKTLSVLNCLDL